MQRRTYPARVLRACREQPRRVRRAMMLMVAMTAAYMVLFPLLIRVSNEFMAIGFGVGLSIAYWVTFVLLLLRCSRELQRLRSCDYRVCVQCEYSLEGLGECGQCPECGTEFDAARLREEWRRRIRFLRTGRVDRDP